MRVNRRLPLPSRLALFVAGVLWLGLLTAGGASALSNGDPCGPLWTEDTPRPQASQSPPPPSPPSKGSSSTRARRRMARRTSGPSCHSITRANRPARRLTHRVSYTWDFGDGNTETDSVLQPETLHTYAKSKPGGYEVTLTVTEQNCEAGANAHCFTAHLKQTVVVQDRAPAASFTAPASALTRRSVSFDASASADPDGTITSYLWNFGDGQTQNTTSPTTAHSYRLPGPKMVTLTLTDDSGTTAQVSHEVSVAHLPPVASFTAPKSVSTGQLASFDASASSDSDGTITSYRWNFGDGTSQTTAGPRTFHVFHRSGTWAVVLTVTDDGAGTSLTRHAVTVTDRPLTASFAASRTVTAGLAARFDASGSSDPDGTITRYLWDFGDGARQTTAGPSVTHTYRRGGTKTVTLTITDDHDNTARAQHTITVLVGRCIVPRLVGTKLAQARKLLRSGNCRLGTVRHKHAAPHRHGRVIHQGVKPGTIRPPGAAVAVTVGN